MDEVALQQIIARRTSKLKWQDPPRPNTWHGESIKDLLPELDKRPGKWAILREYPRSSQSANPTACRLRKRYTEYEFVSRADGKGGSILYGRKIK